MNSYHEHLGSLRLLARRSVLLSTLIPVLGLNLTLGQNPAQDAKMKWFREAKFGLFIHWGLYAIPAGEWKGQRIAGIGEWIMNRAKIPVKEYEQLAAQFNPVKFNAEEIVRLAEDAGMKYIVFGTRHHDGFCLWVSKVSDFTSPLRLLPNAILWRTLSARCEQRVLRWAVLFPS